MQWGMQNRLNRIIKPRTGKCVMLAVDHGYFQGPTSGLRNLGKTVEPLLPLADALMITRGGVRNWIPPATDVPIVLRVSGGASILKELSNEAVTTTLEDAIRINASAVACSIFIGGEYEKQSIANLAYCVNEGEKFGIPVLAVTAVGKEMARDARYLGLASRIATETGAHAVKTYHCENFPEVVEAAKVPVVIAGGKKIEEKAALEMAARALKDGAVGVDMGRNIFQSDRPVEMMKAVRAVVHDGLPVKDAYHIYQKKEKCESPSTITTKISGCKTSPLRS